MVATLSALTNAAQAASYYEADDYYAEGGLAPSEWQGKGAEALKLQGAVEHDQFSRLLEGRVADQQLGTAREGEIAHRPGWDLTFSAPKSVSILAEVAGDRRLVEAHERAVRTALGLAETHFAATRIREDGEVRRETTGNLVIATFRHGTSRALDPQLHSHNIILNMTQDDGGQWRSLEPRAFYQLQKQLGAIYRQELAGEVQRLGYAIDKGRDSGFEVAGLDAATLEAFSQRSQAIEAHLSERGTSREEASAAEKQMAALDTRQAKEAVPHADLVREWRAVADSAGWNEQARREMVAQAEARARTQAMVEDVEHAFDRECAADRAVARGASMLGERQSVFATTALHEAAGRFAFGEVGHAEIGAAIVRAQKTGALEARSFVDRRGAAFEGLTTAANIADEAALLRLEESGRNQVAPILAPVIAARAVAQAERRAESQGHAWNEEQRAATTQILTSHNRIVALQGAAGTAKTSTVLATVAEEAQAQGLRVTALAPTASAALDSGGGHVVEHEGREARFEQMARDFAALDEKARKRALVIEPSRDGRDILTGKIREKLAETGALHGPAVELSRLVSRDMTRTEAKEASSYAIGDVVRFTKDYADKGVSRRDAYTVAGIDTEKAAVILTARDGRRIDWRLRQWGATQSQVFTAEPIELRAGDRVQFTRNDRAAGRLNGQQGEVIGVDPEARTVTLRMANRRIEHLTPDDPRDRHIAHAWVATAFAAQGHTADRVLVHADSAASQLVDQKSFYVALSRARESIAVYTNDRAKLVSAIQERSGIKQTALAPAASVGKVASAQIGDKYGKAATAKGMAL